MKHKWLVLILSGLLLLLSINPVLAVTPDEKSIIDEVTPTAQKFVKDRSPGLDLDKKHYGLSEAESFADGTISDGIPYYYISETITNSNQISKDIFSLGGFMFPIIVNGKQAGVVDVRNIKGKWDVYGVFSNLTLEQELREAKSQVQDISSTMLLHDEFLGIRALLVTDGDKFDMIPLRSNDSLGLVKNEKVSFDSKADTFRQSIKNAIEWANAHPGMVGGGIIQTPPESTYDIPKNQNKYIITVGVILALAAAVLTIKRRHKSVEE